MVFIYWWILYVGWFSNSTSTRKSHSLTRGQKKLKENIQERAFQAREIEEETASKSNKDHNWPRDHNKAVVSEGLKMKAKDRL